MVIVTPSMFRIVLLEGFLFLGALGLDAGIIASVVGCAVHNDRHGNHHVPQRLDTVCGETSGENQSIGT